MKWDAHHILDSVATGLCNAARLRDVEQAVYGIDALDELGLHPLLHASLRDAAFGVWPEQCYPSERSTIARQAGSTRRGTAAGQRCDIVLTHDARPLLDTEAEATLFGEREAVPPQAAYWLEVKTVSQFTVDGPFARYAAELLTPVTRDIRKLARDPVIFHAGLLLVLFNDTHETAEHDLDVWQTRALQKGFPVGRGLTHHSPITDRIGNGHMATALFPVRRL